MGPFIAEVSAVLTLYSITMTACILILDDTSLGLLLGFFLGAVIQYLFRVYDDQNNNR